jgi:hypothetical protein
VEIISRTEINKEATFEILLKKPRRGKSISGDEISGYKLIDGTKIICADKYAELAEWLKNKDTIVGAFTHKGLNTIILQSLKSDMGNLY